MASTPGPVQITSSNKDLCPDYVRYLCELLANATSDVALGMLSESFERDEELLLLSLETVLQVEEVAVMAEDGWPRWVLHACPTLLL